MISVCMPSYNRASYLAESIESVLNQSYKDLELIIVDDGSTDSSKYLYDYYTNKDKRVKVIYNKHKGISVARNTAIQASQGEFIAVMDADDVMVLDRLKLSVKAIKDHDFVYSNYGIFDGQDIKLHEAPKKVTLEDVKKNGAWPHVTIMARKECFLENPYRDDFTANDDEWLVWKWFQAGYKAKFINKPLMVVRAHEGNVSKLRQTEIKRVDDIVQKEIDESCRNN